MDRPALRAVLDTGDSYDDPSEDTLFMILEDIDEGEALWVIVEKVPDDSQEFYAQAIRREDGTYVVERRQGSQQTHETSRHTDLRSAHQQLTAWSFDLVG